MTSYTNPRIVSIPSPIGVDAGIEACRVTLGGLPWLSKIFGRAIFQHTKGEQGTDVIFPEVWGPNREPQNVMINDNLTAYCFFVARDPERFNDYVPLSNQVFVTRPVSVIIWANLLKVDKTKTYRFSELLKVDVLRKLTFVPGFALTQTFESYSRIFEGFTITDEFRRYLKPPYWAIRIDGDLKYAGFPENCGDIVGDYNEDFNNDFTNIEIPDGVTQGDFNQDYNNDFPNQ